MKDMWWLMCRVSIMTPEFFERGLKPFSISKVHGCQWKDKYDWIIKKKDFLFRCWFFEWTVIHLSRTSLSLSPSFGRYTCVKLRNIPFLAGCDMIGLLICNETKPTFSLSLIQGWLCTSGASGSINGPVKGLALGPAIYHLWLMLTKFLFKALVCPAV